MCVDFHKNIKELGKAGFKRYSTILYRNNDKLNVQLLSVTVQYSTVLQYRSTVQYSIVLQYRFLTVSNRF